MKNAFNLNEVENAFEIGRMMQFMLDNKQIDIQDSKEAFYYALTLAIDFEKEHEDTEDYYNDLGEFVVNKLIEKFGVENK